MRGGRSMNLVAVMKEKAGGNLWKRLCVTPIGEDRMAFGTNALAAGVICTSLDFRFYDPHASRQCREPTIPEG